MATVWRIFSVQPMALSEVFGTGDLIPMKGLVHPFGHFPPVHIEEELILVGFSQATKKKLHEYGPFTNGNDLAQFAREHRIDLTENLMATHAARQNG